MGYKNSPPYVQRQIDNMLREFRDFVRAYIDDIVVFSRTLEKHVNHLHQIFDLFSRLNISLNPKKSYLGYPTIQLLGQKDRYGHHRAGKDDHDRPVYEGGIVQRSTIEKGSTPSEKVFDYSIYNALSSNGWNATD